MQERELKFLEQNRQIDYKHVDKLCASILKRGYIEGLPINVTKDGYIIDGQHRYLACQKLGITPKIVVLDIDNDLINSLMLGLNVTQKDWLFSDYVNYYAQQGNGHYLELIRLSKQYKISLRLMSVLCINKQDGGRLTKKIKDGAFSFDYSEKGLIRLDDKIKAIFKMREVLGLPLKNRLLLALSVAYNHPSFIVDDFIKKVNKQRDRIYSCTTVDGYLRIIEDLYNYHNSNKIYLSADKKGRNNRW